MEVLTTQVFAEPPAAPMLIRSDCQHVAAQKLMELKSCVGRNQLAEATNQL